MAAVFIIKIKETSQSVSQSLFAPLDLRELWGRGPLVYRRDPGNEGRDSCGLRRVALACGSGEEPREMHGVAHDMDR